MGEGKGQREKWRQGPGEAGSLGGNWTADRQHKTGVEGNSQLYTEGHHPKLGIISFVGFCLSSMMHVTCIILVRYHCGGWSEEVNSCILIISYMVYL
jgi:hypothetical protein